MELISPVDAAAADAPGLLLTGPKTREARVDSLQWVGGD